MFRRLTVTRVVRILTTLVVVGFFSLLIRSLTQDNVIDRTRLSNPSPLESFYFNPNHTDGVLNPHPFEFLIDPGSKVCSDSKIYLLVYVHSDPSHVDRRTIIRNTWGNVSQYGVPVRVVFVMGVPAGEDSVRTNLVSEAALHNDIVQESFIDTYYNMTYKAVAALKWVTSNCPQATFVLKTDDDAFVNMFTLLRSLVRMSNAYPTLHTRTMLCNLWNDDVPRYGKWKLERSVFRFHSYPAFCQGLAFIMSRDLVEPLYNATYYTPFLRMDDVYLTGFVIMRVEFARKLEMNRFYVEDYEVLKYSKGEYWMEFLFSHVSDPKEIIKYWTAVKNVNWDP